MSVSPIRFFHRGELVAVHDVPPTRSVLDWLREDARCTGTKEGCNEGDCGACTVVIGELAERCDDPAGAVRGLALRSVNACLMFLPALHGKALFTVEDLKTIAARTAAVGASPADAPLHPVQQALVDCHGSQCGFCTPGFTMSMFACYERERAAGTVPTRREIADELAGNLCRCTGYRPILDAGEAMFTLPPAALDTAPVIAALRAIPDAPLHYRPSTGGPDWFAPRSLDALAALREAKPTARLVAGSTDVGLWVTKQFRPLGDLISTTAVEELKRIETRADGALAIGAGVSLEAAWRALADRSPTLQEVWLRFASPPIRHAGTLGGNVANGSPIGDGAPVLIALDASIELRRGAVVRSMPLADFYVDYMKNRLEPGEFVQGLVVPAVSFQRTLRAYKLSKRYDSDISAVLGAFALVLDGDVVREVRLAFGGMAAIVKRAAKAEAALVGQPWNEPTLIAAQAALADDFTPLTDMRASAAYRMQAAQNLLRRFWLETRADAPLDSPAASVWHSLRAEGATPAGATR